MFFRGHRGCNDKETAMARERIEEKHMTTETRRRAVATRRVMVSGEERVVVVVRLKLLLL